VLATEIVDIVRADRKRWQQWWGAEPSTAKSLAADVTKRNLETWIDLGLNNLKGEKNKGISTEG
jgi:hypothetical protein